MILSARRCSTRVALTEAPERSGVPVATVAPSPTINTSGNSSVAPGSPTSFSTAMTSSLATLYCLPPVRMTANMIRTDIGLRALRGKSRTAQNAARTGPPGCERRNIVGRSGVSTISRPNAGQERLESMWRELGWTAGRISLGLLPFAIVLAVLFAWGALQGAVFALFGLALLAVAISHFVSLRMLGAAARAVMADLGPGSGDRSEPSTRKRLSPAAS